MNAYTKLLGMLVGLGAWATLPAVIGGYLGNPFRGQPWIEEALGQGAAAGRWPGKDLVVDLDASGAVTRNAFAELPVVGEWPRPVPNPRFPGLRRRRGVVASAPRGRRRGIHGRVDTAG